MQYSSVVSGIFIARPNRFIAHVEIDGNVETVHVKNTGRCKELLIPGVPVYLEPSGSPLRKTKWSLIAVQKGDLLINMDSQIPNKALEEALLHRKLAGFPDTITQVRREYTYGDSRLDFLLTSTDTQTDKEVKTLVEVKGVTLEQDGVVSFPDAPTLRGIKHLRELTSSLDDGYNAIVCFVIQMERAEYFQPNWSTHYDFGTELIKAQNAGVKVLAYSCRVTPDEMSILSPVDVRLERP